MTETDLRFPLASFRVAQSIPTFCHAILLKKPNLLLSPVVFRRFPLKCTLYLRCNSLNMAKPICNAINFDNKEYFARLSRLGSQTIDPGRPIRPRNVLPKRVKASTASKAQTLLSFDGASMLDFHGCIMWRVSNIHAVLTSAFKSAFVTLFLLSLLYCCYYYNLVSEPTPETAFLDAFFKFLPIGFAST